MNAWRYWYFCATEPVPLHGAPTGRESHFLVGTDREAVDPYEILEAACEAKGFNLPSQEMGGTMTEVFIKEPPPDDALILLKNDGTNAWRLASRPE